MSTFIIRPERMIKELSSHLKGKLKGSLNWYFNSADNMVYMYYNHISEYVCIMNPNEIPMDLRLYMGKDTEILGTLKEYEEMKEEMEEVEESVSYPSEEEEND